MDSSCVAVDYSFNDSPPSCWPHFDKQDLLPDNVYPGDGTNQYKLISRCSNTSAGSTLLKEAE
jgi:hypothetical protein